MKVSYGTFNVPAGSRAHVKEFKVDSVSQAGWHQPEIANQARVVEEEGVSHDTEGPEIRLFGVARLRRVRLPPMLVSTAQAASIS